MRVLSKKSTELVSGGTYSKSGYEANTAFWSLVGFCTTATATTLFVIPVPYGDYFAVRFAAMGAGSVAGYAFGAVEYYVHKSIESSIDYYLSPEQ